LLAGILPTLERSDLTLDNITPCPRYYQLNDAVMRMRGGAINAHIKGLEEVNVSSDNIMLLSSNTSFQVHLQVGPAEFVPLYNMAQAVTAPVLAAAVNSPLWLGNRLWHETRLALFQHSADARSARSRSADSPRASASASVGSKARSSNCSARTSRASDPSWHPRQMRIPSPYSRAAACRASPRSACTTARSGGGTAPATASRKAGRT
jgi:hypothetical protein